MSTEAVQKFWQKAQQDKALQAKLTAIPPEKLQAGVAALVKVAAEAGFLFTAQEYEAAVKKEVARQHAAGELTEGQLQQIAGGAAGLRVSAIVLSGDPTTLSHACHI